MRDYRARRSGRTSRIRGLVARFADDRQAQTAADHAGDVPERHTLVGDAARPPPLLKRAFAGDGRPDLGKVFNPATSV
jgi:hypothetical protein